MNAGGMETVHTIQGTSAEAELQSIKDDEMAFEEAATASRDIQPAVGTPEATTSARAVASQRVDHVSAPESSTRGTPGSQGSHQNEASPQRSRHITQNQAQANHAHRESQAHRGRQSQTESQLRITESPPPYPGPPLNQSRLIASQQSLPTYDNVIRNLGSSIHNTGHGPVFVLSPLLPGQMPYSENVIAGHRSLQNVPVVTTRVINRPHGVQQTGRVQVQGRNQRHQAESDYLTLSFAMLVLCAFQGNIPALLCILPALACSMKAQQYNEHGNYRKAAPYGKAALWCNFLALLEYILLLFGIAALLVVLLVFNVNVS